MIPSRSLIVRASAIKRPGVHPDDELLLPREVADMFRVDPKTVTRWAKAGRINSIKTLGGHRRFRMSEVRARLGEFQIEGAE